MRSRRAEWIMVGVVIAVLIFSTALFHGQWIYIASFPPTRGCLEVSMPKIRALKPSEERTVRATLRNASLRVLRLMPPRTDCGCVSVDADARTLWPWQAAELRFMIHAPATPGAISRMILVRSQDDPDLAWTIPVRGQVSSSLWAEPDSLILELDDEGRAEGAVMLRHDADVRLGGIVADSSAISLHRGPHTEEAETIDVLVASSDTRHRDGNGVVQIHDAEDQRKTLLEIPVRWAARPPLRCVPSVLVVDKASAPSAPIERTILVYARTPLEAGGLRVQPLRPWVHVVGRKQEGRVNEVRIRLDGTSIPDALNEAIISFGVDGNASPVTLRAVTEGA